MFTEFDKDMQKVKLYEQRLKELTAAWWRHETEIANLMETRLPCGHTVRDLEQLDSGEVICKGCVK